MQAMALSAGVQHFSCKLGLPHCSRCNVDFCPMCEADQHSDFSVQEEILVGAEVFLYFWCETVSHMLIAKCWAVECLTSQGDWYYSGLKKVSAWNLLLSFLFCQVSRECIVLSKTYAVPDLYKQGTKSFSLETASFQTVLFSAETTWEQCGLAFEKGTASLSPDDWTFLSEDVSVWDTRTQNWWQVKYFTEYPSFTLQILLCEKSHCQ